MVSSVPFKLCPTYGHMCPIFCVLRRANGEIAQVRTKAASEGVALGASLRKEQMKVDSLERAVQQKVSELPVKKNTCGGL